LSFEKIACPRRLQDPAPQPVDAHFFAWEHAAEVPGRRRQEQEKNGEHDHFMKGEMILATPL
jgi:hypothetical protein